MSLKDGTKTYITEKPVKNDDEPLFLASAGSDTVFYNAYRNITTMPVGDTFFAGPSIVRMITFITGVKDYGTMLEMASRGDRHKVDNCFNDTYIPPEICEKYPYDNYPLTFLYKLSREGLENKEYTIEDICASMYSCAALLMEKQMYLLAKVYNHKDVYIGGSLVQDNLYMQKLIGFYSTTQGPLNIYYMDHGSYLSGIGMLL